MMRGSSDEGGGFGSSRKPITVAVTFANLSEWVMFVRLDGRREGEDGPSLVATFKLKRQWKGAAFDAVAAAVERVMLQINGLAEHIGASLIWGIDFSRKISVRWGEDSAFSVYWPVKVWQADHGVLVDIRETFVFLNALNQSVIL